MIKMLSPICYGKCEQCDVATIVFEKKFVTVIELGGEFSAVMICVWCLGPIVSQISEITAKFMAHQGVKVLSWENGEIVLDDE